VTLGNQLGTRPIKIGDADQRGTWKGRIESGMVLSEIANPDDTHA
jgi:hypothetical protein